MGTRLGGRLPLAGSLNPIVLATIIQTVLARLPNYIKGTEICKNHYLGFQWNYRALMFP